MIFNPIVYGKKTGDLSLNDCPWSIISAVAKSGEASSIWKVGDTKSITLNGTVKGVTFSNLKVDAFIIGFDHNSELEGANRIHFQLGKINGVQVTFVDRNYSDSYSYGGKFVMNSTNTNIGGWQNSRMRTTILGNSGNPQSPPTGSFLSLLPQDLRDVIKPTSKWTDNKGDGTDTAADVTSTTDYLFLLSEYEVFGSRTCANSNENTKQKRYQYYALNENSAIFYQHNDTLNACFWWLRSPYYSSANHFCSVWSGGGANNREANTSYGVSPGFAV